MTTDTDQIGDSMTEEAALSLLESTGHGVLSLATDDRAYGIPVSFGYDAPNERFLFEFLNIGDSKKRRFAAASEEVTLTAYRYEDPQTWECAIVTGSIHPVAATDLSERSVTAFTSQADDAAEEIRWAEADHLERQWYEVRPTGITGRRLGQVSRDA